MIHRLRVVVTLLALCVLISPAAAGGAVAAPTEPSPTSQPGAAADPEASDESAESGDADAAPSSEPEDGTETRRDGDRDDDRGTAPSQRRADVPASVVGVAKENDLPSGVARPGDAFVYTITARCSGLTAGCVNQSVDDVLPAGLDVTSLPQSTDAREVSYDAATRRLTIRFIEPLQAPVGALGLNDGATRAIDIGVRLPADTTLADGASIVNEAVTVADNAPRATATDTARVEVPREVRPVATKSWTGATAIAGSAARSSLTLGVRNASSSSVAVERLEVADLTPATFDAFDLVDVEVVRMPAGADRARLLVCTAASSDCERADLTAGPTAAAPGALALPAGVTPAQVTGFVVEFTAADGSRLPYDATGATVRAGLVLRSTVRSTGAPLTPTQRQQVRNCAVPTARDSDGVSTDGAQACATYDILPDTVLLAGSKSFYPDANGSFSRDNGEYAVVGESSRVSATVNVVNRSAFALREIRIVEPDGTAAAQEFAKLDVDRVRLRLPQGATGARLIVRYDDAQVVETAHTASGPVDVARAGARVERIEVVYTGVGADGGPAIAVNATAGLDLTGRLDGATAADLPDGTSPGVDNCAAYQGAANVDNATGTASGTACATLQVERRREAGTGVKTVGQTQVPEGQPIPFSLNLTNNGNVALSQPVLSDPPVDADGRPRAADNPFAVLALTSASASTTPGGIAHRLEVFDPAADAWTAYAGAAPAVLQRATGVRVRVLDDLLPTQRVSVSLTTQRRPGVANGVTLRNCLSAGTATWQGDPVCAPGIETRPAASGAALNKSISPSRLVAPIPGVTGQTSRLRLTVANTGNMSASRLQVTDDDADFFDAVDLRRVAAVTMPLGADRVRFDVRTAGGDDWVQGAAVGSSGPFALPAGVSPGDVVAVRATFSHSGGGYALRPCEGSPTPASCTGAVELEIEPRATLRSAPDTPVDGELENTATAGYETSLQTPGTLVPVAPTTATLELVEGTPQLQVQKTPDSAIAPGETAPFRLTVTNTGTSDLPALRVTDVLPAGLTFDETLAGDGGQPFRIVDAAVPQGTEPVPSPRLELVREGERVAQLRWSFGDWVLRPGARFSIEIRVTLAPGVRAGQVSTNLMGATSSAPGLACRPPSGTDPDGVLGAGRWCTDTAAVTTKAGAAFQARKWVSGTADLGWWNDRDGESVPVGDASCPSRTQAGRVYTAFPCVALVGPGDRFEYLLAMVNAGTEPATQMRIVDRFPVQGDKGVVLDQTDRGTQWRNRPTLASAPVLNGPGALSTTYAHSEAALCTDDLSMRDACGPGTWSDPFGAEAVGAQMRVAWSDPLQPGEGVTIGFSMTAPLDVPRVGDPTVAWNSFGHAETTLRATGQTRVLPPTEPIQVGVATAYGTLEVAKEIVSNPGALPVGERAYDFTYACTLTPVGGALQTVAEGTLQVRPGEVGTVQGVPAGARCEVVETETHGGVTDSPADDPAVVVIRPQLGDQRAATRVTVGNDFPLADLEIVKAIDGDAAEFAAAGSYEIEVSCVLDGVSAAGYPRTVTLRGAGTETLEAPVGSTCSARETVDGGATEVDVAPAAGVRITAGASTPLRLQVTNSFAAGRLAIAKEVRGVGGSMSAGPFTFEVACTFDGRALDPRTVTIERAGDAADLRATVPGILPVGAECTVSETATGGADSTPDPVTVLIQENADDNIVTATFTNRFSAASVAVAKQVDGDGAGADWVSQTDFEVEVTCAVGSATGVVHSERVRLRAGERHELVDADGDPVLVPVGARCWAVETATGGATSHRVSAGSFDEAVEVAAGDSTQLQVVDLEVTNTFDQADLRIDKTVVGAAAGYAAGAVFEVRVTCVLPQDGVALTLLDAEAHEVRAGEPLVIADLPVGAQCWIAESDDGGATGTEIEHDGPASAVEVTADGAVAGLENRFDAGELTVRKRVVDGPAGPYAFTVRCETDRGEVALAAGDAAFELAHGEQRTIVVPLGAHCVVAEPDAPRDATVSFDDSDTAGAAGDGEVTVAPEAAVTVVNTFAPEADGGDDEQPGTPGESGGPGVTLPSAGGPALALLGLGVVLTAGGATLLVARRRREATAA